MAALGLSAALSIAGTFVSAVGTIAAGQAQQQAANYEAQELDLKAGEERAASQRDALQIARQKRLALSRITAVAGASGFSATDPTVLDLTGETAAYGEYQGQMALYGGESRYQGYKAQAEGVRMSGRSAASGAFWSAAGTIVGGLAKSGMFDKYGSPVYAGRYG